jgi:hypothetical protein
MLQITYSEFEIAALGIGFPIEKAKLFFSRLVHLCDFK